MNKLQKGAIATILATGASACYSGTPVKIEFEGKAYNITDATGKPEDITREIVQQTNGDKRLAVFVLDYAMLMQAKSIIENSPEITPDELSTDLVYKKLNAAVKYAREVENGKHSGFSYEVNR
jgi:hypothetical protein